MSNIKTFQDLVVWKFSHELTLEVYKITEVFPKKEIYGIADQMRRAAYSIPSNIAEGFRRYSLKDSIHFYIIADASLEELKYFFILAKDLQYVESSIFDNMMKKAGLVSASLHKWIISQRKYKK